MGAWGCEQAGRALGHAWGWEGRGDMSLPGGHSLLCICSPNGKGHQVQEHMERAGRQIQRQVT